MKIPRRTILQSSLALASFSVFPNLLIPRAEAASPAPENKGRSLSTQRARRLTKERLPTPALLLDLDIFEKNLRTMAGFAKSAGISLRPHAKTHKCVPVAQRQVRAGALGVCVATIREAEAMAAGGVKGLLITSEMVGADKIQRLVQLTKKQPDTMSVVDNLEHVHELGTAAKAQKTVLNILLDIDPGSRRTGMPGGEGAIEFAQHVAKLPNLKLRGIHSYSGASSHVTGFEARREHSRQAMAPAIQTYHRLRELGFAVDILSGGSTGTYNIDPDFKAMTELQVGSYAFMDIDYRRIGGKSGEVYDDFGMALSVLATVISRPEKHRATIDAGFKAFATDRSFGPELKGVNGARYSFGGDEHGILDLTRADREVRLGERLELAVPHCDPNVNLYDQVYCVRGNQIEAVWAIARGYRA